MPRKFSIEGLVNLFGQPISIEQLKAKASDLREAAEEPTPEPNEVQAVLDALVLSGFQRGKTALTLLLRELGWQRANGSALGADRVSAALRLLKEQGQVVAVGEGHSATAESVSARLPALLARPEAPRWHLAMARALYGHYAAPGYLPGHLHLRGVGEAQAMLRLILITGIAADEYQHLTAGWYGLMQVEALHAALVDLLACGALPLVQRELWWLLLDAVDGQAVLHPSLRAWVSQHLLTEREQVPMVLLLNEAERRVHAGDTDGMRALLEGSEVLPGTRPVFEAACLAREGHWSEAAAVFSEALKHMATASGKRKGLLPKTMRQWQLLSLMAAPDPKAWEQARRICINESGRRDPSPQQSWGLWAHAIAVRLGDTRLDPSCLNPWTASIAPHDADDLADGPILAAWLGQGAEGWSAPQLQQLADALVKQGLAWKAELLRQACERLRLPQPQVPADAWPVRFFGAPAAAWRDALAAIVALGETRGASGGVEAQPQTLQWHLSLDAEARVANLEAFELSSSGRGKPKPVNAATLKKRAKLEARDAAVARAIKVDPFNSRRAHFDLVAAVGALVGHPSLVLADAPGQMVELTESLPALSVRRQKSKEGGEHFVFELEEALLETSPPVLNHQFEGYGAQQEAEQERRNSLRILRNGAERARLIRIGPAQRRVAELVAQRWQVPTEAQAELDAALRVLAGHFVVNSEAEAGEPVAPDSRLVAQLEPKGTALRLQLWVRPFGDFGPLLTPGQGRQRLLTVQRGLGLSTQRQLAEESAHLAALLTELPELDEQAQASWLLDEPAHTLAVVERLNQLASAQHPALRALEWPRGRSLQVQSVTSLQTRVKSGRDWFAVSGELQLDEGRVLSLQKLLSLLRDAQGSRFLPLGDGAYLALTEQLRQRLSDLDALAEPQGDNLRLSPVAAGWLSHAADDLGLQGDARWRERAQNLVAAADLQAPLPATLRAELRPYQQQGFEWLARLAQAGFGAILADDMGLGKTVQTLALLLHRAALGPALIVAPTSVCANWVLEAARFAPSLQVLDHGQSDRRVGPLAAGQVLVVSYALLLRDADSLQAVEWASLVLDEAQALKNAATQRVKAVAGLQAGFRIALSGTPVENRLTDLWSLMHLLNPGLLGSATRFAERFANPIERSRDPAARSRLRRLVSPFLLRRTKAEVLTDLPPRTEIVLHVEPGVEERAFLDAARREALERIASFEGSAGQRSFTVLGELTRLRRAACDPRLTAPELGFVGAKVQAFERLARELVEGRHQTLVFSQFTDFLALLAERLDAAGLRYQYLDGSTPAAKRAERVAAFQRGEGDLFLISLKAGGFGLNLTAADYVVIADPWWNPAAEDQAMGRAHRIGQLRPVTVYRLVTAGSVEERIVTLHADKRDLADSVLSDQQGVAPLQADELLDLLRGD